ncbi:major facilitator superfamily domain-containing protein, partial [Diplogelasinospora grovesii]
MLFHPALPPSNTMAPPPAETAIVTKRDRETSDSNANNNNHAETASAAAAERQLVRKVDLCLLPVIWLMSLMSWMDRSNIGNAKIAGLMTDLDLSSSQYSMTIVVFYFGYVVWGPVSNTILARTRPSIYLPAIMLLWGALTCAMAAVHTYPQLLVLRVFVGVLESGLAPGVAFVFSCWYRPEEQAKRIAIYISALLLGGAFGGLLAGAITGHLDGDQGVRGWRWLFIVEGAVTVFWAAVSFAVLPDFPSTCRRFTADQRNMAVTRLEQAGVVVVVDHKSRGTRRMGRIKALQIALSDWRTWATTLGVAVGQFVGCATVLTYFYPTLVNGLGYTSTVAAQYMTVPIWMAAFVCTLGSGFLCDRIPGYRGLVIAAWLILAMIASILICVIYDYAARYALLAIMSAGVWSSVALGISFTATMFGPMEPEARAVMLAFPPAAGNAGNIYGAYLFPAEGAPKYLLGFGVISGTLGAGAATFLAIHFILR